LESIQADANRKRSEATVERDRREDGTFEPSSTTTSGTSGRDGHQKGELTKALASHTNRGAVIRGDWLIEHGRPYCEPVIEGTLSFTEARRLAKREELPDKIAEIPPGLYRVFYADPPWSYGNMGLDNYGHAERHYPPMSIDELCAMPIADLAAENSVLFLWVTSPMLEVAFQVVAAWGFEYKTSFVWDKVRHNMGHYNSVRHELLLVCTRGSCTPDVSKLHDSVVVCERTDQHSEKPEVFRQIIEELYPNGDRLELFARRIVPNWKAYGNEL
jgi:N6-adenosine-specific RNA methylase IME4